MNPQLLCKWICQLAKYFYHKIDKVQWKFFVPIKGAAFDKDETNEPLMTAR